MTIHVHGKTDTGCVRAENEDSIDWWFIGGCETLCCALADGMGGYEGGALASRLALSTIRERMTREQALAQFGVQSKVEKYLRALGKDANTAIQSKRKSDASLANMGTTLVMALVHAGQMSVMHAGDSRCYLYRDGTLSQLTRDDSVAQQMIDDGGISEEEAERTPYRNVLLKAVGVEKKLHYSVTHLALQAGDKVLLCSDGLFNELSCEEIANTLAVENSVANTVDKMIACSLARGANDNVSVILFSLDE